MRTDVAIIGGGISGLATAYELKRRDHRVLVLERQAQTGGNAFSERLGGFLMEHGPSTINAAYPVAHDLARLLGIQHLRCDLGSGVRNRYLASGGGLARVPVGPLGFLVSGYLSPTTKMRMLAEFLLPHGGDREEETVMAFCSRRFGRSFAERVIDPLIAGVYAGRASETSVTAIFPKLVALEQKYGSVSLGLMHRQREGARMPGSRLFSWRDGTATLPRNLARALGASVRAGVTVRSISHRAGGYRIDAGDAGRIDAKAIVLATQPHVAARLLDGLDSTAAAAVAAVEAPPLAVVFLGYRRRQVEHPLDGLGFLVSESEGHSLNGAQFCSTMFPGRAPEGCVAVAGYFGGARMPAIARLGAAELIDLAKREFSTLIGTRGEPVIAKVRHWPLGIPQYGLGHIDRLAALREAGERMPGLYMTGNYFQGPSISACLGRARDTADAAHGYLRQAEITLDDDAPPRAAPWVGGQTSTH